MIQERERRRSNASTISGKAVEPHMVGVLARHEASCLISCGQTEPEGGLSAFVGRHGG
jgi:hypothetical protein